MFFSYNLLIQKNSNFSLIWRYMYDAKKKVNRNELLTFDVTKTCDELLKYVPTGALNSFELQNKMSLYLLAQLFYGITLIHQIQATFLCDSASDVAKSLLRYSKKEDKKIKRKTRPVDGDETEVYNMDLTEPKKKRVKPRYSALLDLTDANVYTKDRPAGEPLMQPILGEQEMFGEPLHDNGQSPRPNLGELNLELSEEIQRIHGDLFPEHKKRERESGIIESLKDPKVSMSWFGNEVLENARNMNTPHFDISDTEIGDAKQLLRSADGAEMDFEHAMPTNETPIYRREAINAQPADIVSLDEFALEPLPEDIVEAKGEKAKRKRYHHLIIDEEIVLSSEEIMDRLKDYSSILFQKEALFSDPKKLRATSTAQLLDPRPNHLKGINSELYALFDSLSGQEMAEFPLTFEQATRLDIADLHKQRRFPIDLPTWNDKELSYSSENVREGGQTTQLEAMEVEPPKAKVSMAELTLSPLRIEEPDIPHRFSSIEPARHSVPTPIFEPFDRSFTRILPMDNDDDFDMLDASQYASEGQKSADRLSQRSFDDEDMQTLYRNIVNSGKNIVKFHEVLGRVTKPKAAKNFFCLLKLLKHNEIKVKQEQSYGEILIKLVIPSNNVDVGKNKIDDN